jgi:hypothetical protein
VTQFRGSRSLICGCGLLAHQPSSRSRASPIQAWDDEGREKDRQKALSGASEGDAFSRHDPPHHQHRWIEAKHVRAAPNRARWRVAVVVLRYFVAVLLAQLTRAQERVTPAGRPIKSRLTSNPLIRTTQLRTVVDSCGNHCATTRSPILSTERLWTVAVVCRQKMWRKVCVMAARRCQR